MVFEPVSGFENCQALRQRHRILEDRRAGQLAGLRTSPHGCVTV